MTIRVLLVDDEELVRSGLRTILDAQEDIEVVGEVADGAVVVPAVARSCPDVVVLDIRMPLVDGIEATRTLRRRYPTVPRVLVLTTFADDENVYAALHAGADGFLPKRARPAEIVDAVRTVAGGESLLFPAAIRSLAVRHAGGGGARGAARVALTDREADALRLMAHGLSNGEIATELVPVPYTHLTLPTIRRA
ncbi:response regulator transcription factor [Modestobacter marinus]|uniref:response regulator transcription factor n=1 Tax=Modestobacter marinus TaxID=477641 RepID=UPI00201AD21C|nr:response regulator transcription factor [Modestobacter marinus]